MTYEEWGICMKLARRATSLAVEYQRKKGRITDPIESSILLYTDDPTAAGLFYTEPDMAAMCRVSQIENVCIIMGENFPDAAFEAERDDEEHPRVAAMWFPPVGKKCPRCRSYTALEHQLCGRCHEFMKTYKDNEE